MNRYDIINVLIRKNNFGSYLEIGVRDPKDCFNLIECGVKHSVDPGYEHSENSVKYKYTSDNFFSLLENGNLDLSINYKWDVIFIDGLHISTQVEKDIANSINHLSDGGFIILHDCNPPDLWFAREDYMINGVYHDWNGTVWKCVYKLRATVDTDYGIGIIKRGEQQCCNFNNPFYEYREFEKNRKDHLNLISIEEFNDIF